MPNRRRRSKQRKMESTAAALQQRYGAQSLRKASNLSGHTIPPHVSTGFPALDAITGCQGVPLGDIALLSGPNTSGKLTVAYKTLMSAQRSARKRDALVAIIDLSHSADPDYVARAGVDLEHLLIARPSQDEEAVDLLLDLVRTQNVRAILVDSLADLYARAGGPSPAGRAGPGSPTATRRQLCAPLCG